MKIHDKDVNDEIKLVSSYILYNIYLLYFNTQGDVKQENYGKVHNDEN